MAIVSQCSFQRGEVVADKEFSYSGDPNYFVSTYVAALKTAGIRVAVIM
jgi:hypothetical protein